MSGRHIMAGGRGMTAAWPAKHCCILCCIKDTQKTCTGADTRTFLACIGERTTMTPQGRAGQGRAGQGRAGQGRAMKARAGQGRVPHHDRAGPQKPYRAGPRKGRAKAG